MSATAWEIAAAGIVGLAAGIIIVGFCAIHYVATTIATRANPRTKPAPRPDVPVFDLADYQDARRTPGDGWQATRRNQGIR